MTTHVAFDDDGNNVLQHDENEEGYNFPETPHPNGTQPRSIFDSGTSVDANNSVEDDDPHTSKEAVATSETKRLHLDGSDSAAVDAMTTGCIPNAKKYKKDDALASDIGGVHHEEISHVMDQSNKDADGSVDKDWDSTCELLLSEAEDSVYRKNAEILLKGMKDRENAQISLESVFRSDSALLEEKSKQVLACAVPVHEKAYEKVSAAEQELISHFASNHTTRRAVVRALDKHNNRWQRLHKKFMARVVHNGDKSNKLTTILSQAYDGDTQGEVATLAEKRDEIDLEPDWDALLEVDPSSREKIQSFLEQRDHWHEACQRFSNHLDETHEELKTRIADVLQSVEEAYGSVYDYMDDQQADLQGRMVSNYKHRRQLDMALEEAIKQQKSMFSRLVARVSGWSTKRPVGCT